MTKEEKNRNSVERNTNWKIVATYLFVIALCCAMFYYIFDMRHSIENQRTNIKSKNTTLEWASQFTQKVHTAQNTSNLIAFSNNPLLINQFAQQRDELYSIADSISRTDFSEQKEKLAVSYLWQLTGRLYPCVRRSKFSIAFARVSSALNRNFVLHIIGITNKIRGVALFPFRSYEEMQGKILPKL